MKTSIGFFFLMGIEYESMYRRDIELSNVIDMQ